MDVPGDRRRILTWREWAEGQMRSPGAGPGRGAGGFTLLEIMVVLALTTLALGISSIYFGRYYRRTSAERAARIFAQDLTLARSAAMRAREPVVVRFDESDLWYAITMESSGKELERRHFGSGGEVRLSAIDLQTVGDSLRFDHRGVADLAGGGGAVGTARFSLGSTTYEVLFNSMGASKVQVQ